MKTRDDEWNNREKELEAMGFKGGQGHSNHEVYESSGIVCAGCMTIIAAAVILSAITLVKYFWGA